MSVRQTYVLAINSINHTLAPHMERTEIYTPFESYIPPPTSISCVCGPLPVRKTPIDDNVCVLCTAPKTYLSFLTSSTTSSP